MPLILFNKPFQVLCQFSAQDGRETLANYLDIPNIYPAGRLDADSEGLMLLTDDGKLQHKIAHPDHKEAKTYLVQVDGVADTAALTRLQAPLDLGDFVTKPCRAVRIEEPAWLWPRNPPIRERQDKPTSWIAITLEEGKNRQVRRMTAAVGLPTLRLVRSSIGPFSLATHPLMPGEFIEVRYLQGGRLRRPRVQTVVEQSIRVIYLQLNARAGNPPTLQTSKKNAGMKAGVFI